MRKHLLVTLAAVMALGFTANMASAQCATVAHPLKAAKFQVSLVQAFVSCGNPSAPSPNTATEGGVPTCTPVQTFNQLDGSPASGWTWDPLTSFGTVSMKPLLVPACKRKGTSLPPACSLNVCIGGTNAGEPCTVNSECPGGTCSGLNPVGDTTDLLAKLKLKGVVSPDAPLGANGDGTLATIARATLDDRVGGPMTVIDFPAGFPFTLEEGKANLQTSADALLNSIGQPGLSHCSTLEIVTISVNDENGNPFGRLGAFLY